MSLIKLAQKHLQKICHPKIISNTQKLNPGQGSKFIYIPATFFEFCNFSWSLKAKTLVLSVLKMLVIFVVIVHLSILI